MGCEYCRREIFGTERDIKEVAENTERHAVLLQCTKCNGFWESVVEERGPKEVTLDFVRKNYPAVRVEV